MLKHKFGRAGGIHSGKYTDSFRNIINIKIRFKNSSRGACEHFFFFYLLSNILHSMFIRNLFRSLAWDLRLTHHVGYRREKWFNLFWRWKQEQEEKKIKDTDKAVNKYRSDILFLSETIEKSSTNGCLCFSAKIYDFKHLVSYWIYKLFYFILRNGFERKKNWFYKKRNFRLILLLS